MGKKNKSKAPVKTAKVRSGDAVALALPPPTGMLCIQVVAPDDSPLEAALVTIKDSVLNTASLATNDKGMAEFGIIPVDLYEVKVEKRGCGPSAASGPVVKSVNVPVDTSVGEKIKLYASESVTSIKAMVPGTLGFRKKTDKRPDNILTPSSSVDESLSANTPVILIRGCTPVELEAVTSPTNRPVDWSVVANENTDTPPTLTILDGGRKAKLPTGVHGSFSVIARLGITKIVWNVVFVWVKVDVNSKQIKAQDNWYFDGYIDKGVHKHSNKDMTYFMSGEFRPGRYAWHALVKLKVIGGGKSKKLGVGKTKIHILQNGVADTLTGNYVGGGTALEVPKGGVPILDSNDGTQPFLHASVSVSLVPDNTSITDDSKKREIWTGDSPGGGFSNKHHNTRTALTSITGINKFSAAIVSLSDDAPDSFVVHAKTDWSADFAGDVDYGTPPTTIGKYKKNGAKTTIVSNYVLVSEATGGKDARAAGFEVFEPRFNHFGTSITWTP